MLHGFLMNRSMFGPQVNEFSGTFRCVTIDARGHGESPTEETFDYWDVAGDVLAVLDHLEIDQAILAGTSQGGFVTLRVALLRPHLVTGLVLFGTSAEAEAPEVAASYRELAKTWREHGPITPVIDAISSICLGDYADAASWQQLWRTAEPEVVTRNVETLVSRDEVISRTRELTVPALVLHGSADGAYPVANAEQLAAALPGSANAVIVPSGAHFLSLTDAEAVNEQLREFFAEQDETFRAHR